jgi:hypothetical protein
VGGGLLTYWYYYLPDYALAVLLIYFARPRPA